MASLTLSNNNQFISVIRITMIIGLVFHHLFEIPNSGFFPRNSLDINHFNLANTFNSLVHWSAMAAVPLLSIISGYLYYNRQRVQHRDLLVKRVYSVLLPGVVWTSLWFIFAYALVSLGRPYGQFRWLDYGFDNLTWLSLFNGVVGITKEPVAFQFWFIHDLVLTLLIAPVIAWLLRRFDMWIILALTVLWLSNKVPPPFFSLNVLFFFSLGAFIAIRAASLEGLIKAIKRWQLPIFGLFSIVLLTRAMSDLHPVFGSYIWLSLLRLAGVLTVSIIVYTLLQRPDSWLHKLGSYSPYSFFIFASHYPIIDFIKAIFKVIPLQETAVGQLLTLLIIPVATTISCIIAAKVMNRIAPRIFAFLNGGRAP